VQCRGIKRPATTRVKTYHQGKERGKTEGGETRNHSSIFKWRKKAGPCCELDDEFTLLMCHIKKNTYREPDLSVTPRQGA